MSNRLERSKRILFDKEYEKTANVENLKYLKRYKIDMELRELSKSSIYNYERDLLNWFAYLNENQFDLSILEATEDDIEEFIYFCKTKGNNASRLGRRISSISAFYQFMRRKKFVREDPTEFIARPKKGLPVVKKVFLTKEQVGLAREFLKSENNTQLTTYFELSLATMARVTAISSIKWSQINYDGMFIEGVLEKEGYIVNLFFDEEECILLKVLERERKEKNIDCDFIFISNQKGAYSGVDSSTLGDWAKKIGKAIGEPELSPHDLRRSGATLRSEIGMPLEQISSLLNHKGTDVTRLYVKENATKKGEEYRKFKI